MQPVTIIILLDKELKVYAQVLNIPILIGVNLLPLKGLHETLATGVVIGIGRAAHARNNPVLFQDLHIFD